MFRGVHVGNVKIAVVPADGLSHQVRGIAVAEVRHGAVLPLDRAEHVIGGGHPRDFRIVVHVGQRHGDQILYQIQHQGDAQSGAESEIFKVDEVAAVGALQTLVGIVLFLSHRAEGQGFPILEDQTAVIPVVENQSELPAGELVYQRRTEYGQHAGKLIGFHLQHLFRNNSALLRSCECWLPLWEKWGITADLLPA